MRTRILLALTWAVALALAAGAPWLAWREARRQAYDAEADITLGYARAVLYRADEAGAQVARGIKALSFSGYPPCSTAEQEIMHKIDLTSTYIQAIGHVEGDMLVCSSLGSTSIPLGPPAYRTSTGFDFYLQVPVPGAPGSLMAIGKGGFAALIHRDLPLDIGAATDRVSLAVMHLELVRSSPALLARGPVERRWLARLGNRRHVVFPEDGRLVAIARSERFLIAGVAAVPRALVDQRARAIARRLVPAGVLAGLALAGAVLLLARTRMSIAAALRYALRKDEFFLQYQPIVDLASGAWVGVEALLRWRRDTGELIGPDLFIPVAEQSGLINQLTRRVLHLVERDAGPFLARHPEFHVALNLSPADVQSSAIVADLDGFLARTGAAASNLIVEITERGFLDIRSARDTIAALRARGVRVAIDDFGTGYSSLSYLESLALDYLKIDRSFIEAIGTGAPTSQVVGHIISMANGLGLRMIAEGVERPEQKEFLCRHGVHFAQGWLYGRPQSFTDIVKALDRRENARTAPRRLAANAS